MAEWFASWFDSPYYPLLYRHRNHEEAERFISLLLKTLAPAPGTEFLDLACGRGRHSRYLHSHGHAVTGMDLSPESIADARQWEAPGLHFEVHDMREPFPGTYDVVLNLFTSFGYFETDAEHQQVLRNIMNSLKPGGRVVIDFLNATKVATDLVANHQLDLDGIHFDIHKQIVEGKVVKRIRVTDPAQPAPLTYQEQVRLFTPAEWAVMLRDVGLTPYLTWGSYEGTAFDETSSPRLILFAKPIA
jgi:SAM-dependent methyltransferase